MTQEDWVLRARKVHGEKFDYRQTVYINLRTKVEVGCRVCGKTIRQAPANHIRSGCNKCNNTEKLSQEEFLLRARGIHGEKYDYSETVYINSRTKVKIGCNQCGRTFYQWPKGHMTSGYFKCRKYPRMSKETFLSKAKQVHGEKYDYSKSIYTHCYIKLEIGCRECDHGTFMQMPTTHLSGSGCPKCKKKTESFVFKTLKDSGYDVGKGTDIQINKGVQLRYDIVMNITDKNGGIIKVIVEVDGGQHFFSVSAFRQTLEETQQNDMVKQQYAIDNDYHVIRIDQQYVWDQQIKHITEWFDRLSKSLKKIEMQEELELDEQYLTDDINKYSHLVNLISSRAEAL